MNDMTELSHSKARSLAICTHILVRHWQWAASGMGGITSLDFLGNMAVFDRGQCSKEGFSCDLLAVNTYR